MNNYRNYNRGAPRRRSSFKQSIDCSKFVKKAVEFQKIEDEVTVNNFADFKLNPVLLKNIDSKGFKKPTQIQDKIISEVLSGKDVLGIAATGTGKTAAFAIPLIERIIKNPRERILILAPTRELAQQIKQEIRSFTWDLRIYISLAIGGAYLRYQIMDIKRDPHIIVGTPGRIGDLAKRRVIDFSKYTTLVLDEVDRMLDMGFINDIRKIISALPAHQTLFFSATVNTKISALIDSFLSDPVKIEVEQQNASDHVDQDVVRFSRPEKEEVLYKLLCQTDCQKALVFASTKRSVESLTTSLKSRGLNVDSIHGDKKQSARQSTLRMFKESKVKVLIATDVAARGIDVKDISHVINYDLPNNYEDYIHRIGRTGRGDAKGNALTFVEDRPQQYSSNFRKPFRSFQGDYRRNRNTYTR